MEWEKNQSYKWIQHLLQKFILKIMMALLFCFNKIRHCIGCLAVTKLYLWKIFWAQEWPTSGCNSYLLLTNPSRWHSAWEQSVWVFKSWKQSAWVFKLGKQSVWVFKPWKQRLWVFKLWKQSVWVFKVRKQRAWVFKSWKQSGWVFKLWKQSESCFTWTLIPEGDAVEPHSATPLLRSTMHRTTCRISVMPG